MTAAEPADGGWGRTRLADPAEREHHQDDVLFMNYLLGRACAYCDRAGWRWNSYGSARRESNICGLLAVQLGRAGTGFNRIERLRLASMANMSSIGRRHSRRLARRLHSEVNHETISSSTTKCSHQHTRAPSANGTALFSPSILIARASPSNSLLLPQCSGQSFEYLVTPP